jgi:flagellar basal body P-ring formation protein FlgA
MKRINYRIRLTAIVLFVLLSCAVSSANQQSTQKAQTIQPAQIRAAVQQYITRHAPWAAGQMIVKKIKFNRPVGLPAGKVALSVAAPKHTDWLGAIPFTVGVAVNGQRTAAFTVPVNIEVWSDVLMTTKPLGRFEPIDRDDIQVKKMDLARVPSNVLVKVDEVLGKRTNRNIAANCILRTDLVEMPPLIKRGDLVEVVAQSPMLKISVKAMAKENGRQGDRIKVVNLRSKKTLYALVVDDHTVRVEF